MQLDLKKDEMKRVQKTTLQNAITWTPDAFTDTSKPWWETYSLSPFEPFSSICVTGPTGAGKSRWVYKFLRHLDGMYIKDPPQKILYCHGVYQTLYDEMEGNIDHITFHSGLPSEADITDFTQGQTHSLIVLDDLMQQVIASKEMELLFTQGCHHRGLSVIFITQNLYGQAKAARTIALNTWYLILFKNLRDASQILTLGRQLYPGRGNVLVESYNDVMREHFAYLVVDMSPRCEDKLRLRTRVFPGDETIVYVPR